MNPNSPNDSEGFWSNIADEWARHEESSEALYKRMAYREQRQIEGTVWEKEWDREFQAIAQIASKVSSHLKHAEPEDLLWIKDGWTCDEPKRRSFTMWIWRHGVELPDDLVIPMLQQALRIDFREGQWAFVEPVVSVRGRHFVIEWLAPFLEDDNIDYSTRSVWAIVTALSEYIVGETSSLEELSWKVKEKFLRRFLSQPPTALARNLIHLIPLVAENCPLALRSLVTRANQIASRHPDRFLRDMYKIKLAEQMKAKNS